MSHGPVFLRLFRRLEDLSIPPIEIFGSTFPARIHTVVTNISWEYVVSFTASSSSLHPPTPAAPELQEKIRTRAYELYLLRGPAAGDALQDWLRAEAELVAAPSPKPVKSRQAKARSVAAAAGRKK